MDRALWKYKGQPFQLMVSRRFSKQVRSLGLSRMTMQAWVLGILLRKLWPGIQALDKGVMQYCAQ